MKEQPKVYEDLNKNRYWYLPSKGKKYFHKEDGPAIEWIWTGNKEWWFNGKRHRIDGPAIQWKNGYKSWWINDKLHRLDGPAVIYRNGSKEWWINGNKLPTKEVEKWIEENKIDLKTNEGQFKFKMKWG